MVFVFVQGKGSGRLAWARGSLTGGGSSKLTRQLHGWVASPPHCLKMLVSRIHWLSEYTALGGTETVDQSRWSC